MDTATMRRRAEILAAVRSFFSGRGYTEVDTPLLAPFLIPESAIEVLPARWSASGAGPHRELYLVPSPELWMKRLLAAGSGSIFQICHCFRNVEERSPQHSVEFTMLEWYTLGATYHESMLLTEELLVALGSRGAVERRGMGELFRTHVGVELELLQDMDAMREAARARGGPVSPESGWEECFSKLFLTFVEPALAGLGAVFVLDYPAAIPTLARPRAGTPYAERWELYLEGVEVANCYTEETDRAALRALAAREAARKAQALVPHPPDPALAEMDLPPCSGVALGVDRLLMALLGLRSIDEVIFFPGFGIL
jgi:lysyl-tRNA synthetase class 2